MPIVLALYRLYQSRRARRALKTLGLEIRSLLAALASPNRFVAEVQRHHAARSGR